VPFAHSLRIANLKQLHESLDGFAAGLWPTWESFAHTRKCYGVVLGKQTEFNQLKFHSICRRFLLLAWGTHSFSNAKQKHFFISSQDFQSKEFTRSFLQKRQVVEACLQNL
jgi:hypothetical protein